MCCSFSLSYWLFIFKRMECEARYTSFTWSLTLISLEVSSPSGTGSAKLCGLSQIKNNAQVSKYLTKTLPLWNQGHLAFWYQRYSDFVLLTLFGLAEESRPKHSAELQACSDSGWKVGGLSAHLFLGAHW